MALLFFGIYRASDNDPYTPSHQGWWAVALGLFVICFGIYLLKETL